MQPIPASGWGKSASLTDIRGTKLNWDKLYFYFYTKYMFLSDAAKRVGQFSVNLLEILIDDNDCHLKHLILATRLQLP